LKKIKYLQTLRETLPVLSALPTAHVHLRSARPRRSTQPKLWGFNRRNAAILHWKTNRQL